MSYNKPIPLKNQDNQPYWDAADQHELAVQKCNHCHAYSHPPGPSCSKCGSTELTWENIGNDVKGTIYSYVISYRPYLPGFEKDLPLIIAQVQIDNIPEVKIMANILDCSSTDVQIGLPVQMVWIDISEERALPQWKLVDDNKA